MALLIAQNSPQLSKSHISMRSECISFFTCCILFSNNSVASVVVELLFLIALYFQKILCI